MKNADPNHYERAFENWLIDHRIQYAPIDERQRATCARHKVKSFDFVVILNDGCRVLAEVKGRKFKGASFEKMAGFECWVTADDVESLSDWCKVSGRECRAVFVFAYKIENVDVDSDGRELFEFGPDRYVFFCISLEDYRCFMKQRSPKWQTVTLSAEDFRRCAVYINDLFL